MAAGEYLYVCYFSNGHIKVGRSLHPASRVAVHAERVACLGVELISHHIEPCLGPSEVCEAELINLCTSNAAKRFKYEWFAGLDFPTVRDWLVRAATTAPQRSSRTRWAAMLVALKASGMTQTRVAEHCGCSGASISALASGDAKEPMHSLGEKIISLHAARCSDGLSHSVAPYATRYASSASVCKQASAAEPHEA